MEFPKYIWTRTFKCTVRTRERGVTRKRHGRHELFCKLICSICCIYQFMQSNPYFSQSIQMPRVVMSKAPR